MPEQSNSTTPQRTRRRQGQRMTAEERKTAQEKFLKSFSLTANVRAACLNAGVDRSQIYRWQEHDELFSFKFKQATEDANDMIRGEMFRRAVQGVEEPVVSVGKVVYVEDEKEKGKMKMLTVKKYSDNLLSLLAKARMPEFREKSQVDATVSVSGSVNDMSNDLKLLSGEQLATFKTWLLEAQAKTK